MRASSRKLATSLERRLNDVVPAPFRLRAEDGQMYLYIGSGWDVTSHTLEIVEDETRELTERLETAVYSVLNTVQDSVSEHLRTPWPSTNGREMAMPGVRYDGKSIHLWFGRDEAAPAVRIPPISITEISPGDGAVSA
jgi:hypothetical protein